MTLVINKIRKIPKVSSQGKQVHPQEPSINLTFPSIGILNHLFISPDSPAPLPDTQTSLRCSSFQLFSLGIFSSLHYAFQGQPRPRYHLLKIWCGTRKWLRRGTDTLLIAWHRTGMIPVEGDSLRNSSVFVKEAMLISSIHTMCADPMTEKSSYLRTKRSKGMLRRVYSVNGRFYPMLRLNRQIETTACLLV